MSPWVCCQLGSREHYAVARALRRAGGLHALVTDAWVPAGRAYLPQRLLDRFHAELEGVPVQAFTASSMVRETLGRVRQSGWDRTIERNDWFQRRAVAVLERMEFSAGDAPVLFAYSYAARRLLEFARQRGWRTVLGQIDPGPREAARVAELRAARPGYESAADEPPSRYWDEWSRECELADRIVVNSAWSRELVTQAGVDGGKLCLVPLAFEQRTEASMRAYPSLFTPQRRMRVLFLGQVCLRKGVAELLEAAAMVRELPIEFWLVGPVQLKIPPELAALPAVRWLGPVASSEAGAFYREADVFILPTHSDGFALTQLEAAAHGLPIVASRNCGSVVRDGVNGLLLQEVSAGAIAGALRRLCEVPLLLGSLAREARVPPTNSLTVLSASLLSCMTGAPA